MTPDFTTWLRERIIDLLNAGFRAPIYVVAIDPNGKGFTVTCEVGADETEMGSATASHLGGVLTITPQGSGQGLRLPVNLLFVDANGRRWWAAPIDASNLKSMNLSGCTPISEGGTQDGPVTRTH